jgi:hypothetical protein
MLHRVALVRTDVSKERIASIIRVTRISELRMLAVLITLMMEALRCSETSIPKTATFGDIPEDGILEIRILLITLI